MSIKLTKMFNIIYSLNLKITILNTITIKENLNYIEKFRLLLSIAKYTISWLIFNKFTLMIYNSIIYKIPLIDF